MESCPNLSFQDALDGWRTIRKCEIRGLTECAGWLRELLTSAKDAELSASAAVAASAEEDEFKELPKCCLPKALKVSALLQRHDYFGASAYVQSCLPHQHEPDEQHPLLLFAEVFSELSLEQKRASSWVAAGQKKGGVAALRPGRLQAATRRASELLEAAAAEGRLDAAGWWLLAGVRRAQQRQSESICALLESLRLCRCFAAAWDDLTQQLAALMYATGGPHGGLPSFTVDEFPFAASEQPASAAEATAASSAHVDGAAVAGKPAAGAASGACDANATRGMTEGTVQQHQANQQHAQRQRQQEQQQQADEGVEYPPRTRDQNTPNNGCSSNCGKHAGIDAWQMQASGQTNEQMQQQLLLHGRGEVFTNLPQIDEGWGGCVVSAAAAAAAAAIAEEAAGWPPPVAPATVADAAYGWGAETTPSAFAAVDALAKKDRRIAWATPSFVSQRLSGASLSSFLCVLGLPDCGVYGRFFFARFCMRINRFNDGLNCLLEILELFPNCPMVVAQLAKCCCELGENDRALEFFYQLEKLNPSRLDFVSDFARILASKNEIFSLQQLAERCTLVEACALGNRCRLVELLGTSATRATSSQVCTYVAPAGVGGLLVRALLARVQGASEQSIDLLHAATALNPMASEGWCFLGYAYMESGDLLSASRAFSAATAAAPAAAAAHLGAGQTQALLHNWPAAERLYSTAVRCRPDLPIVWWHLGKAQKEQRKIPHAFRSFQQCWFLAETTEAAAECFCCAMILRLRGDVGPLTAAVWAERLFEQFIAAELSLSGTASARDLLRELSTDWRPRDSRLAAVMKKAPENVLQAASLLADYYDDKGDHAVAKLFAEILQDFGGKASEPVV